MKFVKLTILFLTILISSLQAQVLPHMKPWNMLYTISTDSAAKHIYHVELYYSNIHTKQVDFHMCTWTPGFYEIVDFAGAVSNFRVKNNKGKVIKWEKSDDNTWSVQNNDSSLRVSYDVKAESPFIGNINLNENYGFIIPGALLLYVKEELKNAVAVKVVTKKDWPVYVATGMSRLTSTNTYYAANFDELYDSPILLGKLEQLPVTMVKGIPHDFIGYNLGDFDRQALMNDINKIATKGSDLIGDIPYKKYSFLAVGMKGGGFGGIEHLNSVAMMVSTKNILTDSLKRKSFYNFLAHEYFHLYNVKRIRPIELGPFDYSKENYTNLLWLSEGVTDYYATIITKSAGLIYEDDVLNEYKEHIRNYENKEGHLYQSATQASRSIWAIRGNPFTRTDEELNKTISVYDKGCALGLILDLKIRHETKNKYSFDDVMRTLYKKYYKELNRGFTDDEFRTTCEAIAGVKLDEEFEYVSTTKAVNYPKYFGYAGLAIDTSDMKIKDSYVGIKVDSNMVIEEVEWKSPARKAGLKAGDKISGIVGLKQFEAIMSTTKSGDKLGLIIQRDNQPQHVDIIIAPKYEKSFAITHLANPDALQQKIFKSWMRN
jgi:predicted metalloprotease with PDZ domain